MLGAPKISPVASVGRGKPVVLDNDRHEEPEDDFALKEGTVERWDLARHLAVVVGQAEEDDSCHSPEETGNGRGDARDFGTRGQADAGREPPTVGGSCKGTPPIPKCGDIELLATLYDASSEGPALGWCASFSAEVEGEKKRAAGTGGRVESSCDIVDPASIAEVACVRAHSDEEEGEAVENKGKRQDVYLLDEAEEKPPDQRSGEVDASDDVELVG